MNGNLKIGERFLLPPTRPSPSSREEDTWATSELEKHAQFSPGDGLLQASTSTLIIYVFARTQPKSSCDCVSLDSAQVVNRQYL